MNISKLHEYPVRAKGYENVTSVEEYDQWNKEIIEWIDTLSFLQMHEVHLYLPGHNRLFWWDAGNYWDKMYEFRKIKHQKIHGKFKYSHNMNW